MLLTAGCHEGNPEARHARLRLLAAAVALGPRTHVELQHDVRSSADGGDEQMFGAE
jgi:hypothetical protein